MKLIDLTSSCDIISCSSKPALGTSVERGGLLSCQLEYREKLTLTSPKQVCSTVFGKILDFVMRKPVEPAAQGGNLVTSTPVTGRELESR